MKPDEAVARVAAAMDRLIQNDLGKARRLAGAFATVAQHRRDPSLAAWACRLQARVLYASGRNRSALEKYRRAERIHRSRNEAIEAARVQKAQVACLMYLGRYRQALKVARKARAVFVRTGERRQLAELDNNVGLIFHRLDRNLEAKRHFDLAYQEFRKAGEARALAHVEFNRANIAANLHHLDESLALYQHARELYASAGMKLGVAQAKYSIAYNHFLMGDFNTALHLFEESQRELDAAGDRKWSGLCDLDRAELFLRLNLPDRSLASAEKAEKIFGELGMSYEAAKAKFFAALACFPLGAEEEANRKLEEAARLFAREGNDVYLALLRLARGQRALESEDTGLAIKLARLAKKTFARRGLREKVCQSWLLEGKVDIARGCAAVAASRLRAFRRVVAGLGSQWLFYQAAHLRAKVALLRGNLSLAADELDAAIKTVEELRGRIRPDDFRYGFFSDKQEIYFDRVEICLKQGDLARALEILEQSKARVLADIRIARRSSRPQGKAYERWRSLVEELNWLYQRSLETETKPGRRAQWMRRELALAAVHKESEVAHAWSLAQNECERSGERWDSPVASDIQKQLSENELLVEYFVHRDRIAAFLVSRSGLQVRALGASANEVARALANFRFQIGRFQYGEEFILPRLAAFRGDMDSVLELLHDMLLTPLENEMDGRRLVIVPHDFLHELPFHALRKKDSGRYLLEERPVSYLPSSSLLRERQKPGQAGPARGGAGGNGFVVFGYPTRQAPQIAAETERLRSFLPDARVYAGEEATLGALRQAAPGAGYLHLAAHGIFRRDNPLFSSLRLADGWLHFHEIVALPLRAKLVTLSGCSTGVQRVVGGDELLGMTRGFLYAGVPSLVVSSWMVADRSTADLMEAFYRGLLEGQDKAEALRAAALKVKDSYDHPYFWAPFFLLGRR